jgi:hypothetical protein
VYIAFKSDDLQIQLVHVAIFLIALGLHINILFIVNLDIVFLIEWSQNYVDYCV